MLYTRKGDDGTTKTWGCDQRMSKSSSVAEALGSLDEINSFLGITKVKSAEAGHIIDLPKGPQKVEHIIHFIQDTLFTIQAQVAGFPKQIPEGRVTEIESITDTIEKGLPPITSFFISGGTELAATFDVARTIARRAERRVVGVHEERVVKIAPETLQYLNRLSSILYALARYANQLGGVSENPPKYE